MTQQRSEAPRLRAKLARSGGVWGWPQQAIFCGLTAGQITKNMQLWPQLPCLPSTACRLLLAVWPTNEKDPHISVWAFYSFFDSVLSSLSSILKVKEPLRKR